MNTLFTCLLIILSISQLHGQVTFTQSTQNELQGIQSSGNPPVIGPIFADLDGDLDLDAIMCPPKGTETYFENTGTVTHPSYTGKDISIPIENPLFSAVDFADLDNDGDLDMIKCDGGDLMYFNNSGNANEPAFPSSGSFAPFGTYFYGIWTPVLVDIDTDGDKDLFCAEVLADKVHYFENTGTPSEPEFTQREGALNPFNSINEELAGSVYCAVAFSDIDKDGDFDAVLASSDLTSLSYVENTGTLSAPDFILESGASPVSLISVFDQSTLYFADLDNDDDDDLVIGYYGSAALYINNPVVTTIRTKEISPLRIYPNPAENSLSVHLQRDCPHTFSILNNSGVEVFAKKTEGSATNTIELDIQHLERGFYSLSVHNDQEGFVLKFVKQ